MPRDRPIATLLTLAALAALGLGASTTPADEGSATVREEVVELRDAPDEAAFASGRLVRGESVRILGRVAGGWAAIEPPAAAFDWVAEADVRAEGRDAFVVVAPRATLRSGRDGALLPGPPVAAATRGTRLLRVDRAPLTLSGRGGLMRFVAVRPSAGERRYVREEALESGGPAAARATPGRSAVDVQVRAARTGDPPELAEDLAAVDATIRAVVLGPVARWAFGPTRRRCRDLLERAPTAAGRAAVESRLRRLDRLESFAVAATEFGDELDRSRARPTTALPRSQDDLESEESFDEEGLLQTSARMVDGQFVAALIGRDGKLRAYADIPPGLDATRYLGRRVGVRGPSRYDENLRAPLITVREIESLDPVP